MLETLRRTWRCSLNLRDILFIQILDGLQMDDGPFNFEMLPPQSQVSSIPSLIASALSVALLLSKGVEPEQPSKNL